MRTAWRNMSLRKLGSLALIAALLVACSPTFGGYVLCTATSGHSEPEPALGGRCDDAARAGNRASNGASYSSNARCASECVDTVEDSALLLSKVRYALDPASPALGVIAVIIEPWTPSFAARASVSAFRLDARFSFPIQRSFFAEPLRT
jgi:hypothetical protein